MYRDNSGNEFHSYEEACRYYGVDTPAQAAAEEAYWAQEEANAELDARFNEALVYSVAVARWALNVASFDPDLVDDCPF